MTELRGEPPTPAHQAVGRTWMNPNGAIITEPKGPVAEGHVRIYAILGYVDEDELWAGPVDEADGPGDAVRWWDTGRLAEVVDVPQELLDRFLAARDAWEEAHEALAKVAMPGLPR